MIGEIETLHLSITCENCGQMGIERVYLSHTQYCSGWDLDKIIEGTIFEKSITTHRHTISPDENASKNARLGL